MLRSAAEAKAMAAEHAEAEVADACLHRDGENVKEVELRARVKAMRAMQRGNWKPRFRIGDVVECKYAGGWCRATVTKYRYREAEWAKGRVAAYQCRIEDGTYIFVPIDHDSLVRKMA